MSRLEDMWVDGRVVKIAGREHLVQGAVWEATKGEVTVGVTKVAEEKEEEADVEGEETMGTKRSRKGEEKEEGQVSLWADVGGEETL